MGVFARFFPLALITLLVIGTGIGACSLQLRPAATPPLLVGPQAVILRHNPVTTAPTANFLSQGHIRQQAQERLETLLAQQRFLGRKIMLAGDSDARYQRLNGLFERVRSVSHLADSDIVPVLIDAPSFEAYTFGGREVIFHTSLSERLGEDALAFVIAHELAHIAAGHASEASSLKVINIEPPIGAARRSDLYSYGHEKEADKIALVYLLLAGFASEPALSLWQEMAKSAKNSVYDLFVATHPATEDRARALRENARLFTAESAHFDADNLLNCNPLYCNSANRD